MPHSLGHPWSTGAALLAGFNFSTVLGRLVSGFSCEYIGPLNTIFIAAFVKATSMLPIWSISDKFAPLIAFAIINGIANGSFCTGMPTVVGVLYGSAREPVAMGMIVTGWVCGYFTDDPIAGYILQAYGGRNPDQWAYRPAIFYTISMAVGAAGFVVMLRLRLSLKLFKKL